MKGKMGVGEGKAKSNATGDVYRKFKEKADGSYSKLKDISKEKFDRTSKRYSKQKGSETLGTSTSKAQQFVSGKNPRKSVSTIRKSK
jgi:hypothetical protein